MVGHRAVAGANLREGELSTVAAVAAARLGDELKLPVGAAVVVGAILLTTASACVPVSGQADASAEQISADDAVVCRELGGGWVHVRYEHEDGSGFRGTRLGMPDVPGLEDASSVPATELAEATHERDANGWDEEALERLMQRELSAEDRKLLDAMPSCLDELRGVEG